MNEWKGKGVYFQMGKLGEILQAIVALSLVLAALVLHIKGIPADGSDEAIPVIVTVYVGGKVIQSVQNSPTVQVPPAVGAQGAAQAPSGQSIGLSSPAPSAEAAAPAAPAVTPEARQ